MVWQRCGCHGVEQKETECQATLSIGSQIRNGQGFQLSGSWKRVKEKYLSMAFNYYKILLFYIYGVFHNNNKKETERREINRSIVRERGRERQSWRKV